MINFTLPTDFSTSHLEGVLALNEKYRSKGTRISELFGALPQSIIGSARDPFCVPKVDLRKLQEHVRDCEENGLEFNYLLNASCLGSEQATRAGRRRILACLASLVEVGVRRMTVAIPYLGQLIKERFPEVKLTASVIAYIDSVDKALFFERIGFDRITVDWDVNRNFSLLKSIRKALHCELEILTNSSCILKCPLKQVHYNMESHRSREPAGDFWEFNPCKQTCMQMLLAEPFRFLTSPFIRPEDVREYAHLGITYFKISGREYKSAPLLKVAEHYCKLFYEGNLVALLGAFMEPTRFRKPLPLVIDNRKLDGFLSFFKKTYPCNDGCRRCMYCARYLNALETPHEKERFKREYAEELRRSFYPEEEKKEYSAIPEKLFSLQNKILRKIIYARKGMLP